jgi:hypothetical protein
MPFPERILEPASQVVHWLSDDFNGSSWKPKSGAFRARRRSAAAS